MIHSLIFCIYALLYSSEIETPEGTQLDIERAPQRQSRESALKVPHASKLLADFSKDFGEIEVTAPDATLEAQGAATRFGVM